MSPLTAVVLCASPRSVDADVMLMSVIDAFSAVDVEAAGVDLPADRHDGDWDVAAATVQAADIVVFAADVQPGVAAVLLDRLADDAAGLHNKVAALLAVTRDEHAGVLAELTRLGCTIAPATDSSRLADDTVRLARALQDRPRPAPAPVIEPEPPARKLFGSLARDPAGIDPAAAEAEQRAAEQDRLVERRRLLDLTRREKGLPEKRNLPRPEFPPGDAPR